MTTLHLRKSIDRSPLRLGFLLIPLALTLFALSPTARAEDGGLPNDSTAEGINGLVNQNNSGFGNTAMGWNALGVLTGASFNTATGYKALLNNNGDNNTADGFSSACKQHKRHLEHSYRSQCASEQHNRQRQHSPRL